MASDGIQLKREPFGFGSALGAFLDYLYSAIFVYRTYELRKYTDHIAAR